MAGEFANLVQDPDANPRITVEVEMTILEYSRFTTALDSVESTDALAQTFVKHIGPDFPEVAKTHYFGIVIVDVQRKPRWHFLE